MADRLSVRQQWILDYLAENPGASMNDIAEDSPVNILKTQEWAEQHPNMTDVKVRSIEYPTAQQQIVGLIRMGLVRREGEGTKGQHFRHYIAEKPETDPGDPLEQAFALEWKS